MSLRHVIKSLRPIDLLLPAGAALVSAGLQNLAERETRQRETLQRLSMAIAAHRFALAETGAEVPPELVDEPHPLDPGIPWLAAVSGPAVAVEPAADVEPPKPPRWKTVAVALGALAGVALVKNREAIAAGFLSRMHGIEPGTLSPDFLPEPEDSSNSYQAGGENSRIEHEHRVGDAACADHGSPWNGKPTGEETASPAESCGWPNCSWSSNAASPVEAQRTAAALHRNACVYRPAGAQVRE